MSDLKILLVGGLLVLAGFAVSKITGIANAYNGSGVYQLMHHSNTAANAGVFRIDTTSGEVSYCFVTGTSGIELVCTKPVR